MQPDTPQVAVQNQSISGTEIQNLDSQPYQSKEVNELNGRFTVELDRLKKEAETHKNLLYLGFFILLVMVLTIVVQITSERITADYEITHAIDLLQTQLTAPQINAKR